MSSDIDLRYALRLLSAGPDRLRTMAALRELRSDLSLKDAKALMDAIPCVVLGNIPMNGKEQARQAFLWIAETEFVNEWADRAPRPANEI